MASASESRPLVLSAFLCLLIAASATVLSVVLWQELGRTEREITWAKGQAMACPAPAPTVVEEVHQPPPEDRVQRERTYLGDEGIDISSAMGVELQHLDARAELRGARVGDRKILPPSTIHVVNLWAVWCQACKEEMPDFQRLFAARRADWGERVRFVAVQVNDLSAPKVAYEDWAESLPAETIRLSDRGHGAPFLQALRGRPGQQPLFFDELPVTLVLDCNRRVRWAKFERLVEGDLRDLEHHLDRLHAELLEEGPDARCQREWCGNGRCEAGEASGADRCVVDCGERPVAVGPAVEVAPRPLDPPELVEVPAAPCPAHCARCTAEGRCIPKLRGASEAATPASAPDDTRCGDGRCEGGEDSNSCCRDCGCPSSMDCRAAADQRYSCVPRLKP